MNIPNTPMQLLEKWGFCPFCLAIKNYTSMVKALYHDKPWDTADPGMSTNPVELTQWLYEHLSKDGFDRFTLDAYSYAFIPVAIIQGVPLCSYHLWSETEPAYSRLGRKRLWSEKEESGSIG